MTVTVLLDDELLARAREFSGIHDVDVLLREALRARVEQEAPRRLAALGGASPEVKRVSRRRS